MTLRHKKTATYPDGPDATKVQPSDWNDTHDVATWSTALQLAARAGYTFGANRYVPAPANMASAPTVSSAANLSGDSTFTRAYLAGAPDAGVWNYLGGDPVAEAGTSTGMRLFNTHFKAADTRGIVNWVEMMVDADVVIFKIEAGQANIRFLVDVDGVPRFVSTELLTPNAGSGGWAYYKLTFASKATRRVTVELSGSTATEGQPLIFGGAYVKTQDQVYKPSPVAERAVVIGSSDSQGVNGPPADAWPIIMLAHLGVRDVRVSPTHSTGAMVSDGGVGAYLWSQRRIDWSDCNPHIVIFQASWSDFGYTSGGANGGQSAMVAAILAEVSAALTALPKAIIIASGLMDSVDAAGSADVLALNTALSAAVVALDNPRARFLAPKTAAEAPLTGTGMVGSTTGSGNRDIYVGADDHWSRAGDLHIGRYNAHQLLKIVTDIASGA